MYYILDIRRYVRSVAVNVEDVKLGQRDQRKLLISGRQNKVAISDQRHPVFEQDLSMPLTTVEDFHSFEEKLGSEPEIRLNLVTCIIVLQN